MNTDVNECERGQHICSSLETCMNRVGGYTCECLTGFRRADDGWCVVITVTTSTSTTTSTTTERPTSNAGKPTTRSIASDAARMHLKMDLM